MQPKCVHSNLYVKGLPPELEQAQLQSLFQVFGVIESCRIVRDATGSKGYGFVKFAAVENAADAIKGMHGSTLGSSQVEVKFADVDIGLAPLGARTPSDNLYVKNLPHDWTEQDLKNLFQPHGSVKECRLLPAMPDSQQVLQQGTGALVRLSSAEEAGRAIEAVNSWAASSGTGFGGFPILVRYADTPEEKARKQAKRNKTSRLAPYDSQLPAGFAAFTVTPESTMQLQLSGGPHTAAGPTAYYTPSPVQQTLMSHPQQPIQPQYSGYEVMAPYTSQPYVQNPQPAQHRYAPHMNGSASYHQPGPPLMQQQQQQQAPQHPPPPQATSLYIKNLPPETDKLFLYERFAPHGGIASVKVMLDEGTGKCRGVGFVNYTSYEGARAGIAAMHGSFVGNKVLHVSLQQQRDGGRARTH